MYYLKPVYKQKIQQELLKSDLMFNKQSNFKGAYLGNRKCLDSKYIWAGFRDMGDYILVVFNLPKVCL